MSAPEASRALMPQALEAYRAGRPTEAQALCRQLLDAQPRHPAALHLAGVIAMQQGDAASAVASLTQAVEHAPGEPQYLCNLGVAYKAQGRLDDALACYERALAADPGLLVAWSNRGNALRAAGRLSQAEESLRKALALDPRHADAHFNLGLVLVDQGRHGEAEYSLRQAAALRPGHAAILFNLGAALQGQGRMEDAVAAYESALKTDPAHADAWMNLGAVHLLQGRPAQALHCTDAALRLRPGHAQAHCNRAGALVHLRRFDEALLAVDEALRLRPDYAEALNHRGNVLRERLQHLEAIAAYDQAIAARPGFAQAWFNRATSWAALRRHDLAAEGYRQAAALNPELEFASGYLLHARMQACDWDDLQGDIDRVVQGVRAGRRSMPPFPLTALVDDPDVQLQAAQTWVRTRFPDAGASLPAVPRTPGTPLRVGYFSADFGEHPVALLTAGMFEAHDRARFEVHGFSLGRPEPGGMRSRLEAAFDRFHEVSALDDDAIAAYSRAAGIDVAIDLGGFTAGARTGVFARRVAPVQASYIGYLGTMGSGLMDYLFADKVLVPPSGRGGIAERVVWLPWYQVNDAARPAATDLFNREALGLPVGAFVFCCFNNTFKITPPAFGAWMRILRAVEGSVLFLYAEDSQARANLQRQAAAHGVEPDRIVFGGRLPVSHYLARYRAADLFLDTWPYNAGTTASDALWAGLPVVTLAGRSFASRMGASVLHAAGLDDLVTPDVEAYVALAVALATDPPLLRSVRERVGVSRCQAPLFDTAAFTRHMERALEAMHGRCLAGAAPADLDLA